MLVFEGKWRFDIMTETTKKSIESIEYLIQNYIFEQRLADGDALPSPRELAAHLACDEESLVKSLQSAEAKGHLSHDKGRWTVVLPETVGDTAFSFTNSARARGLTTKVIEAAMRLPIHHKDDPYYLVEQRAREALDLPADSQFIVIERLRLLDGRPGALQRAYLSPARFADDFLASHDFSRVSLIDLYQRRGYKLLSRDTVLAARFANLYEKNSVNRYVPHLQTNVVLDAEQRLYAENPNDRSHFVLEFLKASYFENWRYEIKNRPAAARS
jgi:DNA-binding GntR family transcriptional regulator